MEKKLDVILNRKLKLKKKSKMKNHISSHLKMEIFKNNSQQMSKFSTQTKKSYLNLEMNLLFGRKKDKTNHISNNKKNNFHSLQKESGYINLRNQMKLRK